MAEREDTRLPSLMGRGGEERAELLLFETESLEEAKAVERDDADSALIDDIMLLRCCSGSKDLSGPTNAADL